MANNLNNKFPKYVESDLNKAKIVIPPRIRKKEKLLFFYSTNQEIKDVEEFDGQIAIEVKLVNEILTQITSPLNFDISSPKFQSISDSGVWGGQINAIIYNDIDLDTSKYSFVTLTKLQQNNIEKHVKYRIVSIKKYFNISNSKFLYAELIFVPDSKNTIKSYDKISWSLIDEFTPDTKIKYIKLDFDYRTLFFFNGLKIKIKPEKTFHEIIPQISVTTTNDLVYKFVKFRQTSPILMDDLSLGDLKRYVTEDSIAKMKGRATFLAPDINVKFWTNHKKIYIKGTNDSGAWGGGMGYVWTVPKIDFYSQTLLQNEWDGRYEIRWSGGSKQFTIFENRPSNTKIANFLHGNFTFNNLPIPLVSQLEISNKLFNFENLNPKNENDRKYLVISNSANLNKFQGNWDRNDILRDTVFGLRFDNIPKLELLSKNEWGNYLYDKSDISLLIELHAPGFKPVIELITSMTEFVKITKYDENHKVIGNPNVKYSTEFKYDESKIKTTIKL